MHLHSILEAEVGQSWLNLVWLLCSIAFLHIYIFNRHSSLSSAKMAGFIYLLLLFIIKTKMYLYLLEFT